MMPFLQIHDGNMLRGMKVLCNIGILKKFFFFQHDRKFLECEINRDKTFRESSMFKKINSIVKLLLFDFYYRHRVKLHEKRN